MHRTQKRLSPKQQQAKLQSLQQEAVFLAQQDYIARALFLKVNKLYENENFELIKKFRRARDADENEKLSALNYSHCSTHLLSLLSRFQSECGDDGRESGKFDCQFLLASLQVSRLSLAKIQLRAISDLLVHFSNFLTAKTRNDGIIKLYERILNMKLISISRPTRHAARVRGCGGFRHRHFAFRMCSWRR